VIIVLNVNFVDSINNICFSLISITSLVHRSNTGTSFEPTAGTTVCLTRQGMQIICYKNKVDRMANKALWCKSDWCYQKKAQLLQICKKIRKSSLMWALVHCITCTYGGYATEL
jgi:hypothetical protein